MNLVRIAVNFPHKNDGFHYKSETPLHVGDLVLVPLGKRKEYGCVIAVNESLDELSLDESKIKNVIEALPVKLTSEELSFYTWIAQYYHYPLGQLIFDCLPHHMKRPRPLELTLGEGCDFEFQPNEDQARAIEAILPLKHFDRFLIHGVTGSGKTLVYLKLIQEKLAQGKSVLFLLPEINLTPQFVSTFSKYIDGTVVSYHSEVSDSQKFQIFEKARKNTEPMLILGVRSSIFIPLNNLGLIIIDEEHDTSFKQDDRCPYNARDVASKKAQIHNVPIVLGSATPSMETYHHFHSIKKGNFFEMRKRAGGAYLPSIELVDARDNSPKEDDIWPFTQKSIDAVRSSLQKDEQVLVFVNRLGFASYVQCRSCGEQFKCPNCSVALRFFKKKNELQCQHCEYKEPMVQSCNNCGCMTLQQKGFGTERLAQVLTNVFPEKKIERFDRDEIKTFNQLQARLDDFHKGEVDVLVGTQMLSKGHNFEKVKLVVILGIDNQLNFPDFRSSERVYQTLTQVAGRAGRYSQDGKVLIQTLAPENPLFETITTHSFDGFYESESTMRDICQSPPYFKIALIHFTSRFQDKVIAHSREMANKFRYLIENHFPEVIILGPRQAMIEKKMNQFSWSILLKTQRPDQLHNLLKSFELNYKSESSVSIKIDVDPYTLI